MLLLLHRLTISLHMTTIDSFQQSSMPEPSYRRQNGWQAQWQMESNHAQFNYMLINGTLAMPCIVLSVRIALQGEIWINISQAVLCLMFVQTSFTSSSMPNELVLFCYIRSTRATYEAVSSMGGPKIKHIQASP